MPLESKAQGYNSPKRRASYAAWSERQTGASNSNWNGGWTRDPEQKKAYQRRYYHRNKDKFRQMKWKSRGVKYTIDDYEQACIKQGNRCAVCLKVPAEGKRLYVDHNHQTGEVRGLLCPHCNLALAVINTAEKAERAMFYLKGGGL